MPESLVWIFSKRYIAGKTLQAAVESTKELNSLEIGATIDVLGEYIKEKHEAVKYKECYLETLKAVKETRLKATVSVKPTMFGLLLDAEFCFNQIREVVQKANELGIKVCLDMEDSSCTDIELDIFEKLYKEFPSTITLVLQAYLRRTMGDLKRLSALNNPKHPIDIRICKGIYIEPQEVAFQEKKEVNKNYLSCLDYMISNGFYSSVATHDKGLVNGAVQLIDKYQIGKERYEFQMLYGVRPKLRMKLVGSGHPMRIYVPYGNHWFGYSKRRLQENPRMITHIIHSLLIRG